MAYIKYSDIVRDTRGLALPNYRVKVLTSAGAEVNIYADSSGTRFTDGAGGTVNYCVANDKGKAEFYWTPATGQVLQVLDTAGEQVDIDADFADKFVIANLPGEVPQSSVTDLETDLTAINSEVATKAATADLASTASAKGVELVAGAGKTIATRTAMKALTSAADKARPLQLTEANRAGVFVWDGSDLSAKVSGDSAEGIYVAPDSDATGASGAWVRQYDGPKVVTWFGGYDKAAIAAAFASLEDGDALYFPPGLDYVYAEDSAATLDGLNNVTIYSDNCTITQPRMDSNTLGGSTKKLFHFANCTDLRIFGFRFEGQHLQWASGLDNSKQVAVLVIGCSRVRISDCHANGFSTPFYVINGTAIRGDGCTARTVRTGWQLTTSTDVLIESCAVYDARYLPSGATAADKTSGYSFLSDRSKAVRFIGCHSERAASDCYRFQSATTDNMQCAVMDSSSRYARREIVSTRSGCSGVTCQNVRAYDMADASVWVGGDFLEPYSGAIAGFYTDGGTNIVCRDSQFYGTAAVDNGVLVVGATDGLTIQNNRFEIPSGQGIELQSPYAHTGFNISGNIATIGTTSNYVLTIGTGASNGRIEGNTFIGGNSDGILSYASDSVIRGNNCQDNGRNGIHQLGSRAVIDGNFCTNSGKTTAGAGIKIAAADNTLGTNYTTDVQGTTTMDYALWVTNVSGVNVGPLVARGITTIRRDGALSSDFNPTYGKANTATDAATIISNLKAAGLMQS